MHECGDCLISFGGHAAAAGLEIDRERLDEFRERINECAEQMLEPQKPIEPESVADFDELDPREVRSLDKLGPFGACNRRPVFVTRDAKIVGQPSVE